MRGYLYMIILILFIPIIYSAPPPLQESADLFNDHALEIINPKLEYFLIDHNITFHIHLYDVNFTDVEDAYCYIHLYDNQGKHILKSDLSRDGYDYEVQINTTQRTGEYGYIVYCNTTRDQGGFISGSFNVNKYGVPPLENFDYLTGMLALFLVGFALLYSSFKIDQKYYDLRLLSYFMSFMFWLGILFYSAIYLFQSTIGRQLNFIFYTIIPIFILVIFAIIYFYIKHRLVMAVETMGNGRFK